MFSRTNKIAQIISWIGILEMVAGFILGFVYGREEIFSGYYEMNWGILFIWCGFGFISGMLIIALSEIIELLHQLNLKKNIVSEDDDLELIR